MLEILGNLAVLFIQIGFDLYIEMDFKIMMKWV